MSSLSLCFLSVLVGVSAPGIALAQEAQLNTGDTAWVLIASSLVLVMTVGLGFFYGGLVRSKNVVSVIFQNLAAISVIGLLWILIGYSFVFSPSNGGLLGGFQFAGASGVGQTPNMDYSPTIPHLAFMMFQCMFAIISPALISGAVAERMRVSAWLWFIALWSLIVYVPVAHWVWAVGGWIRNHGGLDFAGGLVVHMTAGFSALVAALVLGRRSDFGKTHSEHHHDTGMVALGTGLLFFGWFGFNAGSALSANGVAAQAFATTFAGAVTAAFGWCLVDMWNKKPLSLVSGCIGIVVGLVAITPACGFVSVPSALIIGFVSGFLANFVAVLVKNQFKIDDTLDVFACHGIGGTIGTILTPVFASKAINSAGTDGVIFGEWSAFNANLTGAVVVALFSMAATFVILKVLAMFTTLRVSDNEEQSGLDRVFHGECIDSVVFKTENVHKRAS